METPDWKVLVALGIAAIAVVSAFFALTPDSNISGFFTAAAGQSGNVSLVATLLDTPFSVSTQAAKLTLTLPKDSEGLVIAGQILDLSALNEVEVILIDWNGKVEIKDGLFLSGSAKKVIVNSIGLTQEGKSEPVSAKGIVFKSAKLSTVSINDLKVDQATGTIDITSGKQIIRLEKEPLELSGFIGNVILQDGVVLEGTSSRVLVSGKNTISVQ